MYSGPLMLRVRHQRRERNHLAVVVAHVVPLDVLFALPLLTFRLQEHSPLPAEAIELVQIEAAQIGLQRLIHVPDGHALLQALSRSTSA